MSDSNDDLLNYELGEDLDDQTLLAGDDDELFLSDEEIDQQISLEKNVSREESAQLKNEAEEWVNSNLKQSESDSAPASEEASTNKSEVTKVDSSVGGEEVDKQNLSEVESNKQTSQNTLETDAKSKISEEVQPHDNEEILGEDGTNQVVDSVVDEDTGVSNIQSDETSCAPETPLDTVSQTIAPTETNISVCEGASGTVVEENTDKTCKVLNDQGEENEERHERANIKQTAERDDVQDQSRERYPGPWFQMSKRGRVMKVRGTFPGVRPVVRYPHIIYPQYQSLPNENVGPHMSQPYFSFRADQLNSRQPSHFLPNNQIQPRMEYRPPMGANFRQQSPGDFNLTRCGRQEYPNNVNGTIFNAYPGSNMVRPVYRPESGPQIPSQRFESHIYPPAEQLPAAGAPPNNLGYGKSAIPLPMPGAHSSQAPANVGQTQFSGQYSAQSVLPRKVLINPNFKGGVEAATNQLMKDTQFIQAISTHVSHLQSDEELLRQQEEFINKNRIHIEKRRHERSPDRRSRDRSYSPPRRDRRPDSRERRGGSRGRARRAGSRDFEQRGIPKRRRSSSFERRREKEKPDEEEDAETRAYRMEIEKQKAMREKILRDKEMRRRRAAEEKLKDDDKPLTDEPPQKLKPIIVTESKIISLKKKPGAHNANEKSVVTSQTQNQQPQQQSQPQPQQQIQPQAQSQSLPQQTVQKTIPTAKILPEAKRIITKLAGKDSNSVAPTSTAALAVIKPVVKKIVFPQLQLIHDALEDEMLEEELLADTPSPPSSPSQLMIDDVLNTRTLGNGGASLFSTDNRRIVLKSSKDVIKDSKGVKKRIFDRLDKKVVIDKAAKRKIKRIVLKKVD